MLWLSLLAQVALRRIVRCVALGTCQMPFHPAGLRSSSPSPSAPTATSCHPEVPSLLPTSCPFQRLPTPPPTLGSKWVCLLSPLLLRVSAHRPAMSTGGPSVLCCVPVLVGGVRRAAQLWETRIPTYRHRGRFSQAPVKCLGC